MMPIAMLTGCLFYKYVSLLAFTTPYLIATMLFVTYCTISFREIQLSRLHVCLLAIQIPGSLLVYCLLAPWNVMLAQGAMICILAPTATSAPIISSMLGANVASVATYCLISNLSLVILAPFIFAMVGNVEATSFAESALIVAEKVFFLLLLPFICANLLKKVWREAHTKIKESQGISFYLWSAALTIITGKTVSFILNQQNPSYRLEISLALISLILCCSQFFIGRKLGKKYGDTIGGGQSLGQKNTILAIWMAQTYLNPIISLAPGMYILWQNIINSYQVWLKGQKAP